MKLSSNGYVVSAGWTAHVFGQVPPHYLETEALDEQLVTVGTIRVLILVPRSVADVDVVEPNLSCDVASLLQRGYGR